MPDHFADLSDFTLALLDVASLTDINEKGHRQAPVASFGSPILP
jgi:hypothetical protein